MLAVNLHGVKGIAVAVGLCIGLGACGAASGGSAVRTASPAVFRTDLIARLRAEHLNYRWVVCVRTPHRFRGVPIVRCNVDFGDPHIQAYCSVLRGSRLLTSAQDPAIQCGHDDAGYSAPIVQYG